MDVCTSLGRASPRWSVLVSPSHMQFPFRMGFIQGHLLTQVRSSHALIRASYIFLSYAYIYSLMTIYGCYSTDGTIEWHMWQVCGKLRLPIPSSCQARLALSRPLSPLRYVKDEDRRVMLQRKVNPIMHSFFFFFFPSVMLSSPHNACTSRASATWRDRGNDAHDLCSRQQ